MAISGKVAAVYVQTDDAAVAFTNEECVASDDGLRHTIADEDMRYWDPDTPVVVKVDGETVTSGFTLEHAGGVVVFDADPEGEVTVSGKYLTVEKAGGFYNWSLDLSAEMAETTAFGDPWKKFTPTVKEASGSAECYWGDERFFDALGSRVVIALYVDDREGSKQRYEGFARISSDGVTVDMTDVIKETIDFQGDGPFYYRAA
jgi:hypothetical protein